MHYGCKEKFALRFYQEEVAKLPQLKVEEKESETISIVCKLCESAFDSERLFVRHISFRHFPMQLCDELPKSEPFICPFIDCGQEKPSIHVLMLHYGCEHNISMELYQKLTGPSSPTEESHPSPARNNRGSPGCSPLFASYLQRISTKRPILPTPVPSILPAVSPPITSPLPTTAPASASISTRPRFPIVLAKPKESCTVDKLQYFCKFCPEKKFNFSAKKSLQYHILFSHFFPNLPQSGPCECPICSVRFSIKNIFANHFIENHYQEYMKTKSAGETKQTTKEKNDKKEKIDTKKEVNIFGDDFIAMPSKSSSKHSAKSKNDHRHEASGKRKHGDHSSSSKKKDTKSDNNKKESLSSKHQSSSKKESESSIDKQDSENDRDDAPLPASRVRQTFHSVTTPRSTISSANPISSVSAARQKMMENWKKDSIDSQKFEIDQLKACIEEMRASHEKALKKKTEDFERWITQREKALEEECERRKLAEAKLEALTTVNGDTEHELMLIQTKNRGLQEELDEQVSLCQQAVIDKKKVEKEMAELKSELLKLHNVSDEKSEDLKAFRDHLDEKLELIRQLQEGAKELKSNEERLKFDFQKQIQRLERNVESNVKKVEKLNEEKKNRTKEMKETTKKNNDRVNELTNQVSELTREVKQLNTKLAAQKTELEKTAKTEMKRLEQDQSKIEKQLHESQLAEKNQALEKLEMQKNGLLDSLVHMQKMVQGFEVIIGDKKETIQEQEGKIADLEALVEESLDKANKLKVTEKEKKELQKQVKTLQTTLVDWESRQFTNAMLISGLEKAKTALEQKVKDFEENHKAEEELYEMSTKIRNLEKEVKRLNQSLENADSEHAQTKSRLKLKNNELASTMKKTEDLEQKIRDLEREVRSKDSTSDDVHQLKQTNANLEAELEHLRIALNNRKTQFNQLKSSSIMVEAQLKALKCSNTKFETDYSMAVSQMEILKKNLRDRQLELARRDQQLANLREVVRKETGLMTSAVSSIPNNCSGLRQVSQILAGLNGYLDKDEKAGANEPGLIMKIEPINIGESSLGMNGSSMCVTTDKQIVLNIPIKEEPLIPNPDTFSNDSIAADDEDDLNGSSFELDTLSHLRVESFSSIAASTQPRAAPSSVAKSSKKKRNQLEDVTGHHFPDEDATVCGICHEYDPPRQDENSLKPYTTEWVGCDCDRWFHKTCTKLQRFTTLFSCRSVKMKCIGVHVPLKSKRPKKKVQDQPEEEEINLTVVHH